MQAAVTDRNKLPGIQLGGRGNGIVLVFMGIGLFGLVWFGFYERVMDGFCGPRLAARLYFGVYFEIRLLIVT
jgi:hypothetical protein